MTMAGAASHRVFFAHESLVLLRNDVTRLATELEGAVDHCIESYRRLHRQEGWDDPPVEYIALTSAPFLAINGFLESEVRPALARWEQACAFSKAGEKLPAGFRPEDVCWLLAGRS
jgi:hypothetical protein